MRIENHTAAEHRGEEPFTFSQFTAYVSCSMQYWFARVDRFEPDCVPVVLLQDAAIHRAMELFHHGRMVGDLPSLDDMFDAFDETWEADADRISLPRVLTLERVHEDGHAMLRALYECPYHSGQVVTFEQDFEFRLSPELPPIADRIDLVERDDRGRLVITKYKSVAEHDRAPGIQLTLWRMALEAMGYEDAARARVREIQVNRSPNSEAVEYFYRRPGTSCSPRHGTALGPR